VYAQVLLACVRLNLFEHLSDGPQDVATLARCLALSEQAATQLLRAAAALELVERRGRDRFGLGVLGAALLANPGLAELVEHHALFYSDLRDPVALLRGEVQEPQLARYWPYASGTGAARLAPQHVDGYSSLMAASLPLVSEELIDAYPIEQYRCLLDVGGGEGAFLTAAGKRAPRLKLMLFDLPAVAERARSRLAAAGLGHRATTVGGDFFTDELPRGADIATLVRVIHDHDDDGALAILRAVRRALPSNGILLLAEPMCGASGAETVGDAYFAFYLLAMGRGRPRTPEELEGLLHAAGFPYVRLLQSRMPLQTQIIMASPKRN
jgi:demethylspheroidene O-methyltransferase